ncbi:MAG: TIGR03619 family F420-dependent LLM class oxidoreductase, partial [Candidatus Binatia bacterium]
RAAVMGPVWYEPAATLGFVAGATERIGLLTHVLVLPYRHPLVTAKTYATLDRLSEGRVILGVGSGHARPEFRILGAPFEKRGRLTDESIGAIRAAWTDEVASYEGVLLRFRDVVVAPRPFRAGGPPIWVGGNARPALRRAALLGDGWIPWEIAVAEFREAVAEGARLRAESGRTGAFDWIAPVHVARDAKAGALRAEVGRWQEAGATGWHVGIESRGIEELVERLEWFGGEFVNPRPAL